jgi:hypothetical protein
MRPDDDKSQEIFSQLRKEIKLYLYPKIADRTMSSRALSRAWERVGTSSSASEAAGLFFRIDHGSDGSVKDSVEKIAQDEARYILSLRLRGYF